MKKPNPSRDRGKSLTQQQFKQDADINTITNRYLPKKLNPNAGVPKFGDFTGHDFMTMMNSVTSVETQFAMLPAKVRAMFQNSPLMAVQFVEDPVNKAKAIELGLLPPEIPLTPEKASTPVSGGPTSPSTAPPVAEKPHSPA